jgi:hypothetical protein
MRRARVLGLSGSSLSRVRSVGTRGRDALRRSNQRLVPSVPTGPECFRACSALFQLGSRETWFVYLLGIPGRTNLSTNATCQLEKTENWAPPGPSAGCLGGRRQAPAYFYGESRNMQHMANVGDNGAVSRRSDTVNKRASEVRN